MTSYLISFSETLVQQAGPVQTNSITLRDNDVPYALVGAVDSNQGDSSLRSPFFFSICVGSWVEQMLERADPPNETVEVTRAHAAGITDVLLYSDKWLFRE